MESNQFIIDGLSALHEKADSQCHSLQAQAEQEDPFRSNREYITRSETRRLIDKKYRQGKQLTDREAKDFAESTWKYPELHTEAEINRLLALNEHQQRSNANL